MSVSGISNIAQSTAGQIKPEAPAIEVFEKDGQVMVASPEGQTHVLADKHCYNCVTGFESLQSAARKGEDGGLFELAVKQTEERQKALGVVAQPGVGPLEGLTAEGAIRQTEGPEAKAQRATPAERRDVVALSRSAQLRATGAEVAALAPALGRATDEEVDGPRVVVESHGPDDGHGHGQSAEAIQESPKAREAADEEGDDGHGHGADAKKARLSSLEQKLTESERRQVEELQRRDAEVRAHEQAHKSAGGQHTGAISLSFQTGPDGRKYAVGGEVPVDISPVKGDPEATIQKMQTIQRAALAPAEPSSADRRVASRAAQYANEARIDLMKEQRDAPKAPPKKDTETSKEDVSRAQDVQSDVGGAIAGASPGSPQAERVADGVEAESTGRPPEPRASGGEVGQVNRADGDRGEVDGPPEFGARSRPERSNQVSRTIQSYTSVGRSTHQHTPGTFSVVG